LLFLINQLPYPTMLHQNIQSFVKFYLSDKILQQDLQKKKKIWHKYKVRFNSNKYFPSLWWAGDNRLNVWLTEEGPSYGLNSFTALWITWESERLREITLTENPGKQGESNHIWEGQPRKKTRSNCV
jgi:hypothetical protein